MFPVGSIIKHKKSMDVCYEVVYTNDKFVGVSLINMGFNKSFYINSFLEFPVDKIKYEDWYIAINRTDCYRNCLWQSLA